MALDLCLEASGSVIHLFGADTVNALLPMRRRGWRRAAPTPGPANGFEERLTAAIDRLPFILAHVLWLVDVCRCTYETAAAELGTSPERVELLVAQARRRLRDEVVVAVRNRPEPGPVNDPRRSPAESTNRSRPGWRQPGR